MSLIVPAAFWLLLLGVCVREDAREVFARRTREHWWLDGLGLAIQGAAVPALQIFGVAALLSALAPGAAGRVELGGLAAFALNFVLVDYLYYWNHRLLHGPLWPVHRVHHTVEHFDVLSTSRNTTWASLCIVYLWVNGGMLYLLADPIPYLLAASLTAALDLWRHSTLGPDPRSRLHRAMGGLFVLPSHHAAHHGADAPRGNFGANLSLWDRLHGTWLPPRAVDGGLGVVDSSSLTRKLWWPFP